MSEIREYIMEGLHPWNKGICEEIVRCKTVSTTKAMAEH